MIIENTTHKYSLDSDEYLCPRGGVVVVVVVVVIGGVGELEEEEEVMMGWLEW